MYTKVMEKKPVTYTIPKDLDIALHTKIGVGHMSRFVTQALWEALKREEDALLLECLEADKDPGNRVLKEDWSPLEGEDFVDLDDFEEKPRKKKKKNP